MSDINQLINSAVFSEDEQEKKKTREQISQLAKESGIESASIYSYYMAIGEGKVPPDSTVPAINIRALTYDTARIIFRLMIKHQIGPVIFEIAKSEIEYTDQRPDEYTTAVLAAAIKEGYSGPVFLQGDHFQFSQNKYSEDPEAETQKIKDLIKEAIDGGFRNIDIDASTLVDLSKPTQDQQQAENYKVTSLLTSYIRSLEGGEIISIGGEIGHIGGKNSTPEELEAFMEGYLKAIEPNMPGISKISVQTGTSHGGVPLPGGGVADVELDFNVIESTGSVAREKFHIGGVVQHGASTLPNDLFSEFPKHKTLEIHLATGFQNIVFENMPQDLREEINTWLLKNHQTEWDDQLIDEQNIYKTRKRAIGQFKRKMWELSEEEKKPIVDGLETQLAYLFEELNVFDTRKTLEQYV